MLVSACLAVHVRKEMEASGSSKSPVTLYKYLKGWCEQVLDLRMNVAELSCIVQA